jgi:hypothetical protein
VSEGILRSWFTPKEVALLVALEVATANPFFGIFFSWSHEAIVYTRADKAVVLCVVDGLVLFCTGPVDGSGGRGGRWWWWCWRVATLGP